jgi:hypothetical protein
VLANSVLLSVFRQGADRAHWIGFAAFGWLYLLLLMFGWASTSSDPNSWENPLRPYNLATTKLSAWCYDKLYAQPPFQYQTSAASGFGGPSMGMGMPGGSFGMMPSDGMGPMSGFGGTPGMAAPVFSGPSQGDFVNVSHALWTLLLAACGGWLARWLYATGPGGTKQTAAIAEARG